jgi:hypothetical protein
MTLIEKLRGPARVFYEYAADDGALLTEAADEIERLRGLITKARNSLADYLPEYADRHLVEALSSVNGDTDK